MEQYKYFHNPNENAFTSKFSKLNNTEINDAIVFEKLRELSCYEDSYSFTYTVVRDYFYMVQSTKKKGKNVFVHGITGKVAELKNFPIQYVGKLETEINANTDLGEQLNDYLQLPLHINLGIFWKNFIYPQLIDAVMSGEKQIIIVGDSQLDLQSCIYTLCKCLPKTFSNKISFSFESTKYHLDNEDEIVSLKGKDIVDIRIFLTTNKEAYYANEFTHYVFSISSEIVNNITNYNKQLSEYAKAIQNFEQKFRENSVIAGNLIDNFVCQISNAFNIDGTIDNNRLEKYVIINNFSNDSSASNAQKLLNLYVNNPSFPIDSYLLSKAVNAILGSNVSLDDENLIIKVRKLNKEVSLNTQYDYFNYLWNRVNFSSDEMSETSLNNLVDLLVSVPRESFEETSDLFNTLIRTNYKPENNTIILKVLFNLYAKTNDFQILKIIAQRSCFEYTHMWSYQFVNPLFKDIFNSSNGNLDIEVSLVSAFLLTVFFKEAKKITQYQSFKEERLRIFVANLKLKYSSSKQIIDFILNVRGQIQYLARRLNESLSDNAEEFKFLPTKILEEIVKELTLEESLDYCNGERANRNFVKYTELYEITIDEKCLNKELVKKQITEYNSLALKFETFLQIPINNKKREELLMYFEDIKRISNTNQEMCEYRLGFIKECYRQCDVSSKGEIAEIYKVEIKRENSRLEDSDDINSLLCYDNSNDSHFFSKRKAAITSISTILRSSYKFNAFTDKAYGKYISNGIISGIILMIISFITLMVVPIIKSLVLDVNFFEILMKHFNIIYILFALVVGLIYMLTYFNNFFNTEVVDKQKCSKIAMKNTFLYGLLPILFFVVTYCIIYFIGDSIIH